MAASARILFGQLWRSLWRPVALIGVLSLGLSPLLFIGATDIPRTEVAVENADSPLARMAQVALYRVGYYQLNPNRKSAQKAADLDAEPDSNTATGYVDDRTFMEVSGQIANCSRDSRVLGLIAAESYARPAWRRQIEFSLARSLRSFTGRYPDWSYGLGQIRLSTARRALDKFKAQLDPFLRWPGPIDLSDDTLFEMLETPCDNILLASIVADDGREPGETIAQMARRYRGGHGSAAIPGVISYEALVVQVSSMVGYSEGGDFDALMRASLTSHPQMIETDPQLWPDGWPIACYGVDRDQDYTLTSLILPDDPDRDPPYLNNKHLAAALKTMDPSKFDLDILIPEHMAGQQAPQENETQSFEIRKISTLSGLLSNMANDGFAPLSEWRAARLRPTSFDEMTGIMGPLESNSACSVAVAITPTPKRVLQRLAFTAPAQ